MKSYTLLLPGLVAFALVCPSFGRGFAANNGKRANVRMSATVSEQDEAIMKMRAYKAATEEMGENADEIAMLTRVEEITDKLLRESFPEAYIPAPKKKRYMDSEDIWENGTVVRYLARAMAVMLAMAGLYAWNDNQVAAKPNRAIRDTPTRSTPRSASNSKKKTR